MKTYKKRDFPVHDIRRFIEPGPIVLVSSAHKGEHNIMTMGWHMVMEFSPSLVGCLISNGNHSHGMVRQSGECVINVPEVGIASQVVGIGNC
ncbi:MAG: flavin reductase family protein, partial [Terriglobia bacterium]